MFRQTFLTLPRRPPARPRLLPSVSGVLLLGRRGRDCFAADFILGLETEMIVAAAAQLKGGSGAARAQAVARPQTADAIASLVREEMGEAWPGAFYKQRVLTLRTR